MAEPWPTEIRLSKDRRVLTVAFDSGERHALPAEYLRVFSPSAEVLGHSPEQRVTVGGKEKVEILRVEPVGNYAVQPRFSDGHDSGIFSWDYLYFLGSQQDDLWRKYEERLADQGVDRDAAMPGAAASACGHSH